MTPATRLLTAAIGLAAILSGSDSLFAQSLSFRYGSPRVRIQADYGRHGNDHRVVRRERVWVPGCRRLIRVPARYAYRHDACGRRVRVLVEPQRERIVWEPGHWEWRSIRVRGHRRHG